MFWTIRQGLQDGADHLAQEVQHELDEHPMPLRPALVRLFVGLVLLVASSRSLVWGAVEVATFFGVDDLIIGLTIVAIGTSLPELASSLVAVRKGEHDIALGNILGSNIFNTLAVVGIAGAISPMSAGPEVFSRDIMTVAVLTLSLFFFGYGFRGLGRINRFEGAALLACYVGYNVLLVRDVLSG
jgi:cation:H+ antiporter